VIRGKWRGESVALCEAGWTPAADFEAALEGRGSDKTIALTPSLSICALKPKRDSSLASREKICALVLYLANDTRR
jgi:hypothetical protein